MTSEGIFRNKTMDNRDMYEVTLPANVLFTLLIATIESRVTETEIDILFRHGYGGIAQMVHSLTEEYYRKFLDYAISTNLKIDYIACSSNDHFGTVLATSRKQVEILCEHLKSLALGME